MRSQFKCSTALVCRTVTALLIGLLAVPAHAQQLEWIRGAAGGSANPRASHANQDEFQLSPQPRRVAKQPRSARPVPQTQHAVHETSVEESGAPATLSGEVVFASAVAAANHGGQVQQVCHDGACECGASCGCGVGIEPGCGCVEPGCGCVEPGCACGVEPGCGCGDGTCGGCFEDCTAVPLCLYLPPVKNIVAFAGVQGFKNPLDGFRDRGNFGFNTGFNLGGQMALLPFKGLGYQVGYRATFNQLNGSQFDAGLPVGPGTADAHTQSFLTAGLFRRNKAGLQYGLVYDFLNDERIADASFNQVRGQISITNPKGGEVGFLFSSATSEEIIPLPNTLTTTIDATFQASDQFLGFYRFTACGGGEFRVLAGGDRDSRGIVGADMLAPLTHNWSINTGFRYLIAGDSAAGIGSTEEAWNLGINLIYHFRGTGKKWHNDRYRPLFDVADNGSFSVDQVFP